MTAAPIPGVLPKQHPAGARDRYRRRLPALRTRLLAVLAAGVNVAAGLTVRAVTGGWFGKYAGDAPTPCSGTR